jgi:hypothetical protein
VTSQTSASAWNFFKWGGTWRPKSHRGYLSVGTNAPREYASYPLRQACFRSCLRSPRDRGHWSEAGRNAWTLQAGRHRLGGRQMDRQFPGAHDFAGRYCQDLLFHPLRSLPSIGPGATRGRTNRPLQKSPWIRRSMHGAIRGRVLCRLPYPSPKPFLTKTLLLNSENCGRGVR